MEILRTWRMAVLSVIPSWSKRAHNHVSDHSTTVVLTQYHVKVSVRDNFLHALGMYALSSRRAAGNIMAEAYYEQGDTCILWIIERWSNCTFYKKNRRTAAAKAVSALTKAGLVSPVETIFIKDLESFSKEGSLNIPRAHHESITIMLFVDLKNGVEDHFRSINDILMSAFLSEPGVLTFQISRVSGHKNRYIVYKKFRDRDAFRYHLKDPVLEPLIRFLQTSVKEPPFEKGYHRLIQFAPLE